MKRLIIFIMIFLMTFSSTGGETLGTTQTKNKTITVEAQGAVLIDNSSGEILFQKNSNKRLYPASTTKILTALLAIEKGNLNDVITLGKEVEMIKSDSSKAGLRPGERISIRNLIIGLMLPSGNDAANALAVYIGRKTSKDKSISIKKAIDGFVSIMNHRVTQLGATGTHFTNPHGYHNKNHYTTAYDMALFAKEAMTKDFFRQVVKLEEYNLKKTKDKASRSHSWKNRNELILKKSKNYYKLATGIKTGHTSDAGYCLVSSAIKDEKGLITVVMKSTKNGQWTDSKKLLEYGFEQE